MKKIKVASIVILLILLIVGYWVSEPIGINPFSRPAALLATSEIDFNCEEGVSYRELFKAKADSIVNNAVLMNDFIGVSAGVYKEDCGSYLAQAGYRQKSKLLKMEKHSLHRTASIAKSITAVAIMQLVERGVLNLDVPIQQYLPEYPKKPEGDITIRQLLKHTSGVKHYSSYWDGISFTHYDNMIHALDEFKDRPLGFVPGTSYEYTTYGYTILGAIIEKVMGVSYAEHMSNNVLIPAGMENTYVEESDKEYNNKSGLYIKLAGRYIKSPKTDLSVKVPGGGFITTAEDLLLFGKAILDHTLLDSSTFSQMVTGLDTLKRGLPYGFGWFVMEDEWRGRIIQHGGSQSGTSTFLRIYLDEKIVVASMANNFGSDNEVMFLARDLSSLAFNRKNLNKKVNYYRPVNKEILHSYVGEYQSGEDKLNILVMDDQLHGQFRNYPPFPLYPKADDHFFYRLFRVDLKFEIEAGKVIGIQQFDDGDGKSFIRVK